MVRIKELLIKKITSLPWDYDDCTLVMPLRKRSHLKSDENIALSMAVNRGYLEIQGQVTRGSRFVVVDSMAKKSIRKELKKEIDSLITTISKFSWRQEDRVVAFPMGELRELEPSEQKSLFRANELVALDHSTEHGLEYIVRSKAALLVIGRENQLKEELNYSI